jgi:hypothetical protein
MHHDHLIALARLRHEQYQEEARRATGTRHARAHSRWRRLRRRASAGAPSIGPNGGRLAAPLAPDR